METEIDIALVAECHKCGQDVEFNSDTRAIVGGRDVCPHCGERFWILTPPWPETIEVLALFGVRVSMDWDNSITLDHDAPLSEEIEDWIALHQMQLRCELNWRARESQMIYCGGPLNAQPHDGGFRVAGQRHYVRIAHANWAVYESRHWQDPRLYFVGTATSKAKARKLPATVPKKE